ncbi:MAG: trimethylamine methyltransferase family protein, partial [Acidobacteriota bacterium]
MLDAATGAYRDSELRDLWSMMRVVDELPNIHYGLRPLVARDVEDPLELDLNTAFAVTAATSKPTGVSFTSADTVDPVVDLFDTMLGGEGRFAAQPFSMAVVVHVVPPLRFSPEGCEIMERAIERGMIVQTCSAGQAGATSPPSLAGSLAQGLAEILAGVVLADAIKPGHPCIHAFMPFVSDLRTGAMTGGSGEAAVVSAAAAQLLRDLDIPNAVSAGITESKTADSQAGYEKSYTVTLSAQAGADMVQLSVGMFGSIMVASPEILVIDADMCGAILRSVRGVEVDPSYLDLAIIEEVVGGEGHYLGSAHTLELMRSEYVYPDLGDRQSVAEWVSAGEPSVISTWSFGIPTSRRSARSLTVANRYFCLPRGRGWPVSGSTATQPKTAVRTARRVARTASREGWAEGIGRRRIRRVECRALKRTATTGPPSASPKRSGPDGAARRSEGLGQGQSVLGALDVEVPECTSEIRGRVEPPHAQPEQRGATDLQLCAGARVIPTAEPVVGDARDGGEVVDLDLDVRVLKDGADARVEAPPLPHRDVEVGADEAVEEEHVVVAPHDDRAASGRDG